MYLSSTSYDLTGVAPKLRLFHLSQLHRQHIDCEFTRLCTSDISVSFTRAGLLVWSVGWFRFGIIIYDLANIAQAPSEPGTGKPAEADPVHIPSFFPVGWLFVPLRQGLISAIW